MQRTRSDSGSPACAVSGPPNGTGAKLRGQCRAAARTAARRMPHLTSTICSRRAAAQVLFGPGGSAAGPKPGRGSFSALLGGSKPVLRLATCASKHNRFVHGHRRGRCEAPRSARFSATPPRADTAIAGDSNFVHRSSRAELHRCRFASRERPRCAFGVRRLRRRPAHAHTASLVEPTRCSISPRLRST